ncbi:unnamed protein product, partial [Prorocentrum cordatum]
GGFAKPDNKARVVEDAETPECADETEEVFLLAIGKGISDGGATRPVMGDKARAQWEELLRSRQLLHEVEDSKSDRRFRFGDGRALEAKQIVTLTARPFGVKKQIATHPIEGWAPLLIARPCMEERGLIRDHRAGAFTMKDLPDKRWMKSERDEMDHFIIDLLGEAGGDADDAMNEGAPADGEDSSGDSTDKDTEGDSVKGDDGGSSAPDPDTFYFETRTEFHEIGSDDEALATGEAAGPERHPIDADTHSDLVLAPEQAALDMKDTLRGPRKRLVWEVFVDQGVIRFRIEEGWDFSEPAVIRDFLNKIDNDKPGDIFFAPTCKRGRPWQRANEKISVERAKESKGARGREERSGAKYKIQGKDVPCKKPTRLQSTNKELIHHMTPACARTEDHVILRGKLAQQAQNYLGPMARIMTYLIAYQGMADNISDINAAEKVLKDIEAIEYTDMMQGPTKRPNASTIRAAKHAHVSLDHLSNAALAVAMQHAGAPAEWTQCAGLSQCEICLGRQRPRAIRVAVLPTTQRFNEVIRTDVHYITRKQKEREILESKLWEKLWISWAGKPETKRMDMGGSHAAKRTHDWMSNELDLIPRGAHHRLGLMGRNHAASMAQPSKCHLRSPDDPLKTAPRMTASQQNTLRNARGFGPAALALGAQPKILGALCDEDFGLSEQAALVDPKGEVRDVMIWRATAATAFIEANCSRAARAALL